MKTSTRGKTGRLMSSGRRASTSAVRLLVRLMKTSEIKTPVMANASMAAKMTPAIQSALRPRGGSVSKKRQEMYWSISAAVTVVSAMRVGVWLRGNQGSSEQRIPAARKPGHSASRTASGDNNIRAGAI